MLGVNFNMADFDKALVMKEHWLITQVDTKGPFQVDTEEGHPFKLNLGKFVEHHIMLVSIDLFLAQNQEDKQVVDNLGCIHLRSYFISKPW